MARPVAPTAPICLPGADDVPRLHVDPRQVEVHREESGAVIEDDRASRKIELVGERHAPGPRRRDGSARGSGEVGALVGRARLPVEHAARAEVVARRGIDGQHERAVPHPARIAARPDAADLLLVLADALELARGRLDVRGIHLELLDGELPGPNLQRAPRRVPVAAEAVDREVERARSDGAFEIDADEPEEEPPLPVALERETRGRPKTRPRSRARRRSSWSPRPGRPASGRPRTSRPSAPARDTRPPPGRRRARRAGARAPTTARTAAGRRSSSGTPPSGRA